ncbi:MAG: hypothetical protein JW910_02710 [Anaerolineae bacterium]|nr:hypothetical protein [Anaerolineae bacterium]
MFRKLSLIVVAIATLSLSLTGVASAQGPDPQPTRPAHRVVGATALVQAIHDLADASAQDVRELLDPGSTLNDVAAALGLDPADVVNTAAASITARLEQAVIDGGMTQEEADAILATLSEDLAALMAEPLPRPQGQTALREHVLARSATIIVRTVAEATGLTPAEVLRQAAAQGQSLAEFATANGADPDVILVDAIAAATAEVEAALANGSITQEQADAILADLEPAYTRMMERPLPGPNQDQPVRDLLRSNGIRHLLAALSEATGMSQVDILAELRASGQTAAEFAQAHGIDPQAIIDAAVVSATEDVMRLLDGLDDLFGNLMNQPLRAPQNAPQAAPEGTGI